MQIAITSLAWELELCNSNPKSTWSIYEHWLRINCSIAPCYFRLTSPSCFTPRLRTIQWRSNSSWTTAATPWRPTIAAPTCSCSSWSAARSTWPTCAWPRSPTRGAPGSSSIGRPRRDGPHSWLPRKTTRLEGTRNYIDLNSGLIHYLEKVSM